MSLPPDKRKQLDAGVALRRYADHMATLAQLQRQLLSVTVAA
jgi:hypothetical protein